MTTETVEADFTPTIKWEARCILDVPLFGSRDESRTIEPKVIAARWTRNSHLQPDEIHLTIDSSAGIDVRVLKNAHVLFYMWNANDEDERTNPLFAGIVTDAEREIEEESSRLTLTAKDYTVLFAEQKGLQQFYVPLYTDTLAQAWAKICDGTGYIGRDDGRVTSSVDALRNRIVFANPEDDNRMIGEVVPLRLHTIAKLQMPAGKSPWWLWTSITGSMGLHTFIDGDRVVVVRPSEYYDEANPALVVYGTDLKSASERVDTSKHSKGVCLQSFDPLTHRVLEAFYPPLGDVTIATSRPGAKKRTVSEDYEVFAYGADKPLEQKTLEMRAREAYEERSRQELQGRLTTGEPRLFRDDLTRISILDLVPGQSIRVEWNAVDDNELRALHGTERDAYLIDRGYAPDVAEFYAANANRTKTLNRVHHVKSVTVSADWSAGRWETSIEYHNVISLA